MSFFSFNQYLRYRLRAKGRHGTHSPFVYAFVEDILRGNTLLAAPAIDPLPNSCHADLLRRIASYYHYNSVLHLHPGDMLSGAFGQYDIIITSPNPADWNMQVNAALPLLADSGMLVFTNIHNTPLHAATWHTIHRSPLVMMSIDMFHTGFVFKSSSFRHKQHFVIK